MNKSDNISELAKALVEVQKTELFALTDKENPFFHSKYADLSSVWAAARKPLTDNGLSIVQTTDIADNGIIIETTLLHISGEYISGRLLIAPEKQTPQGIGSAITYGRRYALAAIIGISPEDDDAESAMDGKKQNGQNKPEEKNTGQISDEQRAWILKIGEDCELTENETRGLVKWCAKENNIDPNHWKISKIMLPKGNFKKVLDKYIDTLVPSMEEVDESNQ